MLLKIFEQYYVKLKLKQRHVILEKNSRDYSTKSNKSSKKSHQKLIRAIKNNATFKKNT